MRRQRAGALYLRDHKLLLISEGGKDLFWTPGGGLEAGETSMQALERELQEELGATLKTAEPFFVLKDDEKQEEIEYFLVDIDLPDTLAQDTKIFWYSKNDFEQNILKVSPRIYNDVFPELIAKKLV